MQSVDGHAVEQPTVLVRELVVDVDVANRFPIGEV